MKRTLGALALSLVLVLNVSAGAAATEHREPVHPDVAYALAAEPGGVATSYTTAEWAATGMKLEVPTVTARAVGSCATGSICAFSGTGIGGTKLSWSTCGSKSTSALERVGSIANARSSGSLQARQGTTVRASVGSNAYTNVAVGYQTAITNIFC